MTQIAPRIQCAVLVDGERCLAYPEQHTPASNNHIFRSLGIPCLGCPAAITWTNGAWFDSMDGTTCPGATAEPYEHRPNPDWIGSHRG